MTDGWGYDEDFAGAVVPVLDTLGDVWWRMRVSGGEHLPDGPVLVAAGHDGPPPVAALALTTALRRASHRVPRLLVPGGAFDVPFLAPAVRRLGGVPLQDADALGLLREGQLVAIFIRGRTDTRFAALATRAGVPVVPCAVTWMALTPLRVPVRLPGPLRALPVPARVGVAFGPPLHPAGSDPGDRAALFDLADAVRDRIADGVVRNHVEQGGATR